MLSLLFVHSVFPNTHSRLLACTFAFFARSFVRSIPFHFIHPSIQPTSQLFNQLVYCLCALCIFETNTIQHAHAFAENRQIQLFATCNGSVSPQILSWLDVLFVLRNFIFGFARAHCFSTSTRIARTTNNFCIKHREAYTRACKKYNKKLLFQWFSGLWFLSLLLLLLLLLPLLPLQAMKKF